MKYYIILAFLCMFITSGCGNEKQSEVAANAKVRKQYSQIIFSGGMAISSSLNKRLSAGQTIKQRRKAIRPPMWGTYEVLKGPEISRPNTISLTSAYLPLSGKGKRANPLLAEMYMLAGYDGVSIATPVVSRENNHDLQATVNALKRAHVAHLGTKKGDRLAMQRFKMADSSVTAVAFHLSKDAAKEATKSNVASFAASNVEKIVDTVKRSFAAVNTDSGFLVVIVNSNKDVSFSDRQRVAHALVDHVKVGAVLCSHSREREGLEKRGTSVIVYNPGISFAVKSKESGPIFSFVFKIHFEGKEVRWVEAQPITVVDGRARIGMGKDETHDQVLDLAAQSAQLDTDVINEYGRGFLDL